MEGEGGVGDTVVGADGVPVWGRLGTGGSVRGGTTGFGPLGGGVVEVGVVGDNGFVGGGLLDVLGAVRFGTGGAGFCGLDGAGEVVEFAGNEVAWGGEDGGLGLRGDGLLGGGGNTRTPVRGGGLGGGVVGWFAMHSAPHPARPYCAGGTGRLSIPGPA